MVATNREILHFTLEYFENLGASVFPKGGLLRVELTPDQYAQLEGRTGPPPFWETQDDNLRVLYLAFDHDAAEADPRAELVCPGSHRLEQMLNSAHRLGRLARCTLLPPGVESTLDTPHLTYLLFHFNIAYEGQWKQEQLVETAVDLTSGDLRPEIARYVASHTVTCQLPDVVVKRQLGFTQAWHIACTSVMDTLRKQDDGWARESLLALAQEQCTLDRFFRHRVDTDGSSQDPERLHHLNEIRRRAQPRAIVRTRLAAVVFTPEDL